LSAEEDTDEEKAMGEILMGADMIGPEMPKEEVEKKKKPKPDCITLRLITDDYISELRKMGCFEGRGKATLSVSGKGKTIFPNKLDAINEAIKEKADNPTAKVRLVVE
jgi:hypothetical protein